MSQNAELKPEFKKGLLDATVTFEQTSFPDPGLSQINGFVDDRTYGKIPKLFERIDPLTILVVVNALYFNDKWATPFEPGQNIKDQFEQASGSKVPVTLMHRFGEFHYVESKTCQKVRLGYQSGLAMTIVLPKEGTSLEACLSEAPVLSHSANEREGNVMIPRWENSFSLDLNPVLQKMGLKSIYQSGALENIAPGTVVSQAIQKTWIRVDEAGTEAAAATAIAMEGAANIADKDGPFEFKANRPFLYFIHAPTGAILFAGAVREPRP